MVRIIKNKIVYEENINNIEAKAVAIVFPDSMQEIKNLVKLGSENTDLIARGSGTSFTGAVIPQTSIIVDLSKMNKILQIDPVKKIAIVEPGVLLSDLNDELESYGLEFPIIPLFEGLETIGGMLAKNACGNREIKYGRILSWTDSLEIIDGKGEQIKVAKSDLSDFIGMEGTTGIIIQASLRLTNKKQRSMTILKANTLQDAFIAGRKLKLKQDVCSIDLINPDIASTLGMEKKHYLFIELESNEGSFKGENYEKFIKQKNKAYKKAATELGCIYLSNIKFLVDSLQDFMIYLEENKIPYFSHMASGVVFPIFRHNQIDLMNETAKLAGKLKGKIAYNFGIGLTKKDSLEIGEKEIFRRVKNRNDPNWRFSRNKLVDYLPRQEQTKEIEDIKIKDFEIPKNQKIFLTSKNLGALGKEEKKEEQVKEEKEKEAQNPMQIAETQTIKRPEPELTPEERDKIKKIASGFFAGGRAPEKGESK
jgi:FAD/FMN-containing dehydrogenase